MIYAFQIKWMVLMSCLLYVTSQNLPTREELTNINNIFYRKINGTMVELSTGVIDNRKCICVPYNLCDKNTKTIITTGEEDGYGLLDPRIDEGICPHGVDVCCFEPKNTPEEPPVIPTPKQGCGIRNIDISNNKPSSGDNNEADIFEFPWVVAILRNDNKSAICGSTLIHPQIVLTASHCVKEYKSTDLLIRAGEWDTQTTSERLPYQEKRVKTIILHPRYNTNNHANDIALLILSDPVTITGNINTICLPSQDENFDSVKQCIVAGWGKKSIENSEKSTIMKKIFLDVVKHDSCQEKLRQTYLGKKYKLNASFTCAGGIEGIDSCEGDGGSPLACPTSNDAKRRYTQAGIVSWGVECGVKDVPGVYANVAKYRNWIDDEVKKAGYESSSYVK